MRIEFKTTEGLRYNDVADLSKLSLGFSDLNASKGEKFGSVVAMRT